MLSEYEDFPSTILENSLPASLITSLQRCLFASNSYCNVAITDSQLTVCGTDSNSIYNLPKEGCDDHFSQEVSALPH